MTARRTIATIVPVAAVLATVAVLPAPAPAQTAADGSTLFKQRCAMCHVVAPGQRGLLGPNLFGVVGRKAASETFAYSPALKASGLAWDKATLDRFLTAPGKLVPGTRMVIALPDARQRASVIAYLATLRK